MNQNLLLTHGIGDGPNASGVLMGQFDVNGSFNTEPIDFTFLQYGIGVLSTAGTPTVSSLIEKDNIGYSSTTIPTLKLELGNKGASNNQEQTISGVVFNSWTLNLAVGEKVSVDVNFTGKTVARNTTIETWSPLTGKGIVFNSGTLKWNSESLSLVNLSLTCNLNPQYPKEIISRFGKQPSLGVRRYTWTATIKKHFDDTSSTVSITELLDEFLQASNSPLSTGVPTGRALDINITEGGTSGDRDFTIQLENSFITGWSESPSLDDGQIAVTINGISLAGKTVSSDNIPIKWFTTA